MGHLKSRKSNKKKCTIFNKNKKYFTVRASCVIQLFPSEFVLTKSKRLFGYPVTPIFLVKNTTFPGILLLKDGY